ncbi:MAG: hypothetical protein EXR62_15830 [Chloroflexi bacterium]|nr:hypothetical protein [Chloroflexota bacterium]
MSDPTILESEIPSDGDRRLAALFDDMEKGQLDFLDQAGKRIIELATLLLGLLFGVMAFGDKFPPPYLVNSAAARVLISATLICTVLSMLAGVLAVQPRSYPRYTHNLTKMRQVLEQMTRYKTRCFRLASGFFVLGSVALALLVAAIVWGV